MSVFAVTYTYSPDAERVDAYRPEHRAFLGGLHEAGNVIVSGPLEADGISPAGALIIVNAPDGAAAAELLDDDPFLREGLIVQRTVRAWTLAIGTLGQ